ncbi:MAG: glycosyltransferase family 4 protein [Candidatus Pacebacteria bacterium]|nr:glycosyltransferase family 4 protein [Candidatus Paceibacterota bacterium]
MKTLTLFFTYGTSLEDWDKNGTLDRELNIYKKFLSYFDKIYFITYGKNDHKFAKKFPKNIIILPKKLAVNDFLYSFLIPLTYKKEIRQSSWLKTNQMLGSWSAVMAKIFFGKKLNIRTGYTESLSYINKTFTKKIITELIEFNAHKFSDISIVTSNHQKDYILKKYTPKNIFVIPNGIDTEIFKPILNKTHSQKVNLLFVGRLHPEKNLLNLMRAIKEIKNIELKIIGRGPLEKNILKMKEKYDLYLELIPSVPNNILPEIYNSADIYVQPSVYEGNPKTILEAMSCGLPVIGTNINGINNVITHEKNGYLCATGKDSIKNAIIEIISKKDLREKIGINARKFIEENYDLEKIIEKEINLYKNNE